MISAHGLLWWGLTVWLLYQIARSEKTGRLLDAIIERIRGKS